MSNQLNQSLLGSHKNLPSHISYDRSAIQFGWLHIGYGAFHRAHQAWYNHKLCETLGDDNPWGLTVANIRDDIGNGLASLAEQDGLYTLTTVDHTGEMEHELIGSILNTIDGVANPASVVNAIADQQYKVVSLTVTEGGYYQRSDNFKLDFEHPIIAEEVAKPSWQTVYSYLHAGLKARMKHDSAPLTIMCCDNLRDNGHRLSESIAQYLSAVGDVDTLAWFNKNVSCPNSMVDRITPRPAQKFADVLKDKFDYLDKAQVMAEPFCQWVVEDNFKGERPPLDQVGVEFVKDVQPYEEVKIRILNAGHISLAYLAAIQGLTYFDEAMQDEKLINFFNDFQTLDVAKVMPDVPVETENYLNLIRERFTNAGIGDTVARLCSEGYSKFPAFLVPTLNAANDAGHMPKHAFAIVASWLLFLQADAHSKIGFTYDEQYKVSTDAIINSADPMLAMASDQTLWGKLAGTPFMVEGLHEGIALLESLSFKPKA